MTSRQQAGKPVSDAHGHLKGYVDLEFSSALSPGEDLDVVFLATPHGASMQHVPALMDSGVKVVDLSGDYRLDDVETYERWYGMDHSDPGNIPNAVYGIPELYRDDIRRSQLVANPGCYPTATILAMAPLLKEGVADPDAIVDAKSGTSGAGMSPSPRLHHPRCGETILAYGVGTHRHTPEIEMVMGRLAGSEGKALFTPHLMPVVRGILSTCYLELKEDLDADELRAVYERVYAGERFIHYVDEPCVRAVAMSNHCQVSVRRVGGRAVAFGAIDNLVKGASGQAVQCANLMLGFDEAAGLDVPGMGV